MKKGEFRPFMNEEDCVTIGEELTIENRIDRISIFGSIDLTCDKRGLNAAKELKAILDLTLATMEKTELPDQIATDKPEIVKNPFA
ncbi:MAG: hypothetical protein PHH28_06310 [Desulfuromonadaceae bacterium]|nr:hypothetical protein [Desulfuromonadaceae bacterium]